MTIPSSVARRLAVAGVLTIGAELAAAVLWPVPPQDAFDISGLIGRENGRPPLRVAALGDSTLTGPGVEAADEIWVRVVGGRLASELGRQVDLRSFGVGGATAGEVSQDQLEHAVEFAPHLAVVSVGANDVIRGVPMRRFAVNLDRIVSTLTDHGSLVMCSGVGDLGAIPRLAPPLRQVVSRLGRRADRVHGTVARRHGALKAEQWGWSSEQFRTRSDVWSGDLFHPNAAGHLVWAEVCWETLGPVLDDLRA